MSRIYILFFLLSVFSCTGKSVSIEDSAILTQGDKEVVCFIYHRFGDSRYPTTNTPVKDFEAHLAYLASNNFQVLTFSEAIDYLQSDKPARKTAVITVDDAYKTFYDRGLPLLKKYSMPATLFINTKTVGGGDYMSWAQLEEAVKNKVEVGNHTHSHDFFLNEAVATRYKTFKDEIELSQSIIEEKLGSKPIVFSYPYGEFDSKMKDIVKESGFKAATAQNSGVMYAGMDLFQCPRFPMSEAYSEKSKFVEKAKMKALRVVNSKPDNFILPADNPPVLTLTFDGTDLRIDQLQCFVQGGECSLKTIDKQKITVTLQATKRIGKKRRTLYTITVPDKQGIWHWYSHVWINAAVE
jgi:peptidoglycan/xylan/chitin deacetylase (PgdA/CDA1 family)